MGCIQNMAAPTFLDGTKPVSDRLICMARLFTGLLSWIEPHLAGRTTFLRTIQIGTFLLIVPALWAIGIILWISWGMADFMARGIRSEGKWRRPLDGRQDGHSRLLPAAPRALRPAPTGP